jgi:hypothetical protein
MLEPQAIKQTPMGIRTASSTRAIERAKEMNLTATATDSQLTAPTASASHSNVQEVLNTSELLTLIFQHLPPCLLFRSIQRVCKTWYSVLSTPSPSLQVSLFLRPTAKDSPLFVDQRFNTHLKSIFPYWLLYKSKLPRPGICSCRLNKCGRFSTATSVTLLPWIKNPDAWQRNVSWRNMLLSQPPCTKVVLLKTTDIKVVGEDMDRVSHVRNQIQFEITFSEGMTMGILHDMVEIWLEEARTGENADGHREEISSRNVRSAEYSEAWGRNDWVRKELQLWDKTGQLLFLHMDLDRHLLSQVYSPDAKI